MSSRSDQLSELDISRAETRAAFQNRALVYLHLYEVLVDELGPDEAAEAMKRAIYQRGIEVSMHYREAAEDGDLAEIGRLFCEGSPCEGELFEPAVEEMGVSRIVLSMAACPLVDAWREHDVSDDDVDKLCSIAAAVDEGTFQGAGLEVDIIERLGKPGCERCLLEVRTR